MKYTIIETDPITVIMRDNGDGTVTTFAADPANSDYQRYLAWLENPEAEHSTES
jgi:hypothetical protein